MTTEDGKVLDKQQLLADLTPLPAGFSGIEKVRGLTVRQWGDAAVVHFWLHEQENAYSQRLKTTYVETDTFQRLAGSWKMVAAQVTVVPRNLKPVRVDTRDWPALEGRIRTERQSKPPPFSSFPATERCTADATASPLQSSSRSRLWSTIRKAAFTLWCSSGMHTARSTKCWSCTNTTRWCWIALQKMSHDNAINSDSKKRRAFVVLLFTAGYGER